MASPNPIFLLGGIGMILVGVAAIWYAKRLGATWGILGWGALIWLLAIILKTFWGYFMNLLVSRLLYFHLPPAAQKGAFVAYVGLSTAILECLLAYLLAYLAMRVWRLWREAEYSQAVGLGVGFGATEALFLGISGLLTVILVLTRLAPPDVQAGFAVWNHAWLWATAPIVERAALMPIHALGVVLVFVAAQLGQLRWFWASLLYKTIVYGVSAWGRLFFGLNTSLGHLWLMELVMVIFGLIGLWGLIALALRSQAGDGSTQP
ncbi:MAG: YhfC family intramembrane metalloprotease [Clostridia bacterium]|nr:YhfC family intramembrane metalloprotease [Clostridia bacterium]